MVVDGVLSTSDGRGRRVASGTNAPMYTSAFLDKVQPSQGLEMHERRLAAALELDQANKVLVDIGRDQFGAALPTSPASPRSSASSATSPTVWKDNQWRGPAAVTR